MRAIRDDIRRRVGALLGARGWTRVVVKPAVGAGSLGARAFYEDPGALFDVTQGFNWNSFDESATSECAPNEYLCNAEVGYDGPTGLGTPDGVAAFKS